MFVLIEKACALPVDLCLMSCHRHKEGKYPENMEQLVICNSSPLDADVNFSFFNDNKGDTYLLDPPTMLLKPSERQVTSQNV